MSGRAGIRRWLPAALLPVLVLGLLFIGREGLTFGKVAEMTAR